MRPPGRSSLQRTFSNSSITAKSNGRIINDSDNAAVTTSRRKSAGRSRGGWVTWLLVLLGLFFLGTFIVLSTVKHYFGTHEIDFITPEEIQQFRRAEHLPYDPTLTLEELEAERERTGIAREKIPRIIHATWKNETLPERWETVREGCQAMLPDFEFKLWTDAGGREFIATMYPDFLDTWDSYPYTIQRADAIRYFVLHRYGGIYMDLDIGCRAHPGPLLHYEAILPVTKPVGVSNDLMFSAPGTAFMTLVINSLSSFNHAWLFMNYPTVMFSTGPMFISAMYSSWSRIHKGRGRQTSSERGQDRVRILPKSLYGKNAKAEDVPESFYWHYYGSSWHAKDAGFIGFLGKYGYTLLLLGTSIVVIGFCYILWIKRHFILQSPRPEPKYLLEPFELRGPSQPPIETPHGTLADTVKSALSEIKEALFKPAKAILPDNPYFPLSTQAELDSDAVSLHSIHQGQGDGHGHEPPAPHSSNPSSHSFTTRNEATFQHPVTKKPHARQRSRDVEKCSPNRSRSTDSGRASANSNWLWGTNSVLATPSTTRSGRTLRATMSPEIICEEPSSANSFDNTYFNGQSTSDLHTSFLPNQNIALLSPPTFISKNAESSTPGNSNGKSGPRPKLSRNHSRKLSDVDDSEQLDLLADLEPVGSATSTRQVGTPIAEYPMNATTRKRALSANGGQTSSIAGTPRLGSPNLTIDG